MTSMPGDPLALTYGVTLINQQCSLLDARLLKQSASVGARITVPRMRVVRAWKAEAPRIGAACLPGGTIRRVPFDPA